MTTALDADGTRRIYSEPLVADEITTDDKAAPRPVAWIVTIF